MRRIVTQTRECGERVKGGVYLSSEGSKDGTIPLWESLRPPVPCEDRFHRGPVLVDGDRILAGEEEENWFIGASADHRFKLSADEWSIQKFGMTTTMRLRIGNCAGLGGVDEAMEYLIKTVAYSPVHYKDAFANLARSGIAELPTVLPYVTEFTDSMFEFHNENRAKDLVSASAALWRIDDHVPPRYGRNIIPHLMRMLVVFNLRQDALAMRERYLSGD